MLNISGIISKFIKNSSQRDIDKLKKFVEKINSLEDKIKEMLSLREKASFVENNIKSDISLIKEFYKVLGFYFVKIDANVEKLTKNRVNLVYKIDKGEKAKIAKIYFLG